MIPLLLQMQLKPSPLGHFRVWLPLFLIWLILLPFVILIMPFFILGCVIGGIDPIHAIGVFWQILAALRGTEIDVRNRDHIVFLKFY